MISFIGLDFQPGRASAVALGRALGLPPRTSAAVAGSDEEAAADGEAAASPDD